MPRSVVKFRKGGVEFVDSVNKVEYTLDELTRAALRDVGKYVCREARKKIHKRTGRVAKNTQYWVRKRDKDLQVGFKPAGFYGGFQEVGTSRTPKIGALTSSVEENIDMIRKIEAQYLSAISSEGASRALIDEGEYQGE